MQKKKKEENTLLHKLNITSEYYRASKKRLRGPSTKSWTRHFHVVPYFDCSIRKSRRSCEMAGVLKNRNQNQYQYQNQYQNQKQYQCMCITVQWSVNLNRRRRRQVQEKCITVARPSAGLMQTYSVLVQSHLWHS